MMHCKISVSFMPETRGAGFLRGARFHVVRDAIPHALPRR
jgi:hypothetical protein